MSKTRIRGEQLRDRTIEGIKINNSAINNDHIVDGANISESKLDINWEQHISDTLKSKKIVDFVQVNKTEIGNKYSIDNVISSTDTKAPSISQTEEGVIIDAPLNKAIIRHAITGNPILAIINGTQSNYEVYGRVTFVTNLFRLSFFYEDNVGTEHAYLMEDGSVIDWQYAKRFNLETVSELFAANEKFVEGTADATSYLNIEQLAKDIYGPGYTLDRDGNANLVKSINTQIADEVTRSTNADTTLQGNINNEKQARIDADTQIKNDLASKALGKGASSIGVQDSANKFTADTVEGVLAELAGLIETNNSTIGGFTTTKTEVTDARNSVLTGNHASIDARIEAGETKLSADINTEKAARESADATLLSNINAEKVRAEGVELTLNAAISNETIRATDEEIRIESKFDTAINNVKNTQTTHVTNLSSTTAGKGASLIGVADTELVSKGYTTVEKALAAIYSRLNSQEAGSGAELVTARDRTVTTVNGYYVAEEFVSLDARLNNIESIADVEFKKHSILEDEIINARGTTANLNTRINRELNPDGTVKFGQQIHTHKKKIIQIDSPTTIINMDQGEYFKPDGTLDVYVNGVLYANAIDFTETIDTNNNGIGINFTVENTVQIDDIVILKYVSYYYQ